MRTSPAIVAGMLAGFVALSSVAFAEEIRIDAVVSPKEAIRLDFADESKHIVVMLKREGVAEGSAPLAGASVTEHGMHDVVPGVGGDVRGYLVFADGEDNVAYIKWRVRAVFVADSDGKPVLYDNGFWEIAGATGKFVGLQGTGPIRLERTGTPGESRFVLEGELVQVP